MKANKELERADILVDGEMEIDSDGQTITAYLETWFDVDKKFGINTSADDGTWLNMYGVYNPFADTLKIACVISRDNDSESFEYTPTPSEAQLIKGMIAEKICDEYNQTPQEFCNDFCEESQVIGGIS